MEKLLEVYNLTYSYEENKTIFTNFNFIINQGEKIWLKGNNGSGKTTLLKIMSNVISGDNLSYTLIYKGKSTFFNIIKRNIIYIPDKVYLLESLTGNENIQFFKLLWNEDNAYLKKVNYHCGKFLIEDSLSLPVENYSLGMKQKLFLSILLARNSSIILLDEPFNNLDVEGRNYLTKYLMNEWKGSFMIASHILPKDIKFDKIIDIEKYSK
ncbi:ABC transporter ATP-binding protein [Anaerobranca gottschalkii]|uniref:ABC-2 type transport system ATP-binding protein n=1 Tax=Anaerobranca gottschalkii DSM 13577 TaxID=1120990 RepID=A0A1I0CJ49_9FIRM|nr:ATP-binding cassette domain-containing protein [Anaerobranca gottschalkii]SET19184.1 ABC-2 type transport system ATP-binding protein [Anaerobranca gottschalkii DSM 13577]